MNSLSSGLYMSGFTVWLLPLERDLNLSRTAASLLFSVSRLEGGVQGILTGLCIDRWGPRIMMIISVILAAAGFMLLPLAKNYIAFLLIYVGILSFGMHAGFNQGVMATVNRWFVRRRGTAFGVVSLGIAMGGAVITPVVAVVIAHWGWQTTALVSGAVILVVALPLALFMRGSPEETGRLPDGEQPTSPEDAARPARFVPVDLYLAFCRRLYTGNYLEQRAFPRAVRPYNCQSLTGLQLEGDALKRHPAFITHPQIPDAQDGLAIFMGVVLADGVVGFT